MEEPKKIKRNALGDREYNLGTFDAAEYRKSRYTYVFKYYDPEKDYHFPYFELFSKTKKHLDDVKGTDKFKEVILYKSPEKPPYDSYIRHNNLQMDLLIEYFKEVFHERSFVQGYQPSHKYFSAILPKGTYETIMNCINDYGLLPIRDLLFEVICIAQDIYVKDVVFWEKPENKKLITSVQTEADKAIKVLDKTDIMGFSGGKTARYSRLLGINFIFNDEAIKIAHSWLAEEFISHFKQYYDSQHYKNWRKELSSYPHSFDEYRDKLSFRFKYARALYNLLTKTGFFKVKAGTPYPNSLMMCIARVMEFTLIPVGKDGESNATKAKKIRLWVQRNDIEPTLTHASVEYNSERLLRYFDLDFIDLGEELKRADALRTAAYIAVRFEINHLMPDLAHIIQCLKQIGWVIGHQVTAQGFDEPQNIPEFDSFKKLLSSVKGDMPIVSLAFKLDGEEKEHKLTQRLPLYLIEQAIKKYQEEEQVEVDTDIIKTTVKKVNGNELQVKKEQRFALPEERFLVRFTESFYNYLLAEAPPSNQDYSPSEKYYKIIGLVLIHSHMFYKNIVDENYAASKVRKWHKLTLSLQENISS